MAALVENEGSKMMGETNLKAFLIMLMLFMVMSSLAQARTITVDDNGPGALEKTQSIKLELVAVAKRLFEFYICF
jgi:hypothetical protein